MLIFLRVTAALLCMAPICAAQQSMFKVIPDALCDRDLGAIQDLTLGTQPERGWYGRSTFFSEVFEATLFPNDELTFVHQPGTSAQAALERLARLLMQEVHAREPGALNEKRIVFEAYLDRNTVTSASAQSSGMFWHRDRIRVDGVQEYANYTLILLINASPKRWRGADLLLQLGGAYKEEGQFDWVLSENPIVSVSPAHNQAIVFKNSECGHSVTPLQPLAEQVDRDVLILTCYFQ